MKSDKVTFSTAPSSPLKAHIKKKKASHTNPHTHLTNLFFFWGYAMLLKPPLSSLKSPVPQANLLSPRVRCAVPRHAMPNTKPKGKTPRKRNPRTKKVSSKTKRGYEKLIQKRSKVSKKEEKKFDPKCKCQCKIQNRAYSEEKRAEMMGSERDSEGSQGIERYFQSVEERSKCTAQNNQERGRGRISGYLVCAQAI